MISPYVALLVFTKEKAGVVPPGFSDRKKGGLLGELLFRNAPQRGVVVEHEETSTERGADQVILTSLNGEVSKRDRGNVPRQLHPGSAGTRAEVETRLGSGEEQIRLDVVLHDPPHQRPVGQIAPYRSPGAAPIGALQQIGRVVAELVVVESGIDGVGVVQVGFDVVDEGRGGDPRHAADFHGSPASSAVFGDLHQAIVRPHVDESFRPGATPISR